jgi:hypothetical protein
MSLLDDVKDRPDNEWGPLLDPRFRKEAQRRGHPELYERAYRQALPK